MLARPRSSIIMYVLTLLLLLTVNYSVAAPMPSCNGSNSIWDYVQRGNHTLISMLFAMDSTNISTVLNTPGANLTLFASTDAAIQAYITAYYDVPADQANVSGIRSRMQQWMSTPSANDEILSYGTYNMLNAPYATFESMPDPAQTVLGLLNDTDQYAFRLDDGNSTDLLGGQFGTPGPVAQIWQACNGVVYSVEGVLLPAQNLTLAPSTGLTSLSVEAIAGSNSGDEIIAPVPPTVCANPSMWTIVRAVATLWAQLIVYSGTGFETVLEAEGVNLTLFVPTNNQIVVQLQTAFPDENIVTATDALTFITQQGSRTQPFIFPQLLFSTVPGLIDLYAADTPDFVPTLLAYWSTTKNNSNFFLKTFDANVVFPSGGQVPQPGVIARTPNGPAQAYALVTNPATRACNGFVYSLTQNSSLDPNTDGIAKTRLPGSRITIPQVQEALSFYAVPFNNTTALISNNLSPTSPSPAAPAPTQVEVERDVVAIAVAVPLAVVSVLLCVAVMVWTFIFRRRKRKQGPNEPFLDELGYNDDLDAIMIDKSDLSLTARVADHESDEARQRRERWQLSADEVDLNVGPNGTRIKLGAGGFGEVYQGVWNGTTPVAVKFIIPHISKREHVENLYKEIEVLKECRHSNIVQFYGAVVQESNLMMVAEYMSGGDLFHALQGPNANFYRWNKRGKYIALDIIRGIVHLHSRKIIHCDIKSPNILLGPTGIAKIGDMGMSRSLVKDNASVTKSASVGTWSWAAPELLLNARINEQVDIYSFGVCLWEICTGEVPQRGCMRNLRVPEECSAAVVELYEKCIESNPAARPSAKQAAKELIAVIKTERQTGLRPSTDVDLVNAMSDLKGNSTSQHTDIGPMRSNPLHSQLKIPSIQRSIPEAEGSVVSNSKDAAMREQPENPISESDVHQAQTNETAEALCDVADSCCSSCEAAGSPLSKPTLPFVGTATKIAVVRSREHCDWDSAAYHDMKLHDNELVAQDVVHSRDDEARMEHRRTLNPFALAIVASRRFHATVVDGVQQSTHESNSNSETSSFSKGFQKLGSTFTRTVSPPPCSSSSASGQQLSTTPATPGSAGRRTWKDVIRTSLTRARPVPPASAAAERLTHTTAAVTGVTAGTIAAHVLVSQANATHNATHTNNTTSANDTPSPQAVPSSEGYIDQVYTVQTSTGRTETNDSRSDVFEAHSIAAAIPTATGAASNTMVCTAPGGPVAQPDSLGNQLAHGNRQQEGLLSTPEGLKRNQHGAPKPTQAAAYAVSGLMAVERTGVKARQIVSENSHILMRPCVLIQSHSISNVDLEASAFAAEVAGRSEATACCGDVEASPFAAEVAGYSQPTACCDDVEASPFAAEVAGHIQATACCDDVEASPFAAEAAGYSQATACCDDVAASPFAAETAGHSQPRAFGGDVAASYSAAQGTGHSRPVLCNGNGIAQPAVNHNQLGISAASRVISPDATAAVVQEFQPQRHCHGVHLGGTSSAALCEANDSIPVVGDASTASSHQELSADVHNSDRSPAGTENHLAGSTHIECSMPFENAMTLAGGGRDKQSNIVPNGHQHADQHRFHECYSEQSAVQTAGSHVGVPAEYKQYNGKAAMVSAHKAESDTTKQRRKLRKHVRSKSMPMLRSSVPAFENSSDSDAPDT